MKGLPSAILGDQRELARLPEASVSNPIQAFSLSKGLSSLAASFPVYSRMRTGAATFLSSRSIFWIFNFEPEDDLEWKGCPRLHARRQSESVDGHQPHILNSSNATATWRDASDSFWPGKSPGGRLPHGACRFRNHSFDPYSTGRGRLTRQSDSLAPIRLIRHGGQDRNPWMLVTSAACGR